MGGGKGSHLHSLCPCQYLSPQIFIGNKNTHTVPSGTTSFGLNILGGSDPRLTSKAQNMPMCGGTCACLGEGHVGLFIAQT